MPTDLRKARELFLHAVGKLPPEQWVDYAAEACGGDVDLEQQLGALLQVHQEAGSFLAAPVFGLGDTLDEPSLARVGTQIGPYKLLQIIGEGGMGVVYMAEQTQPVQRKVALKVIKPGMDSRQVIARFEAERQALAMMDHVNIARVLDAGATEAGLPFFVMELVHGVPITKYCDDNHLTLRQRLELFVPVCQAIQHAHQKGIIHRDIKPSNVMITLYDGQPVPKVIDFGVAKAIEQRLTERTLFTQYGTMVGTLEYMSPEQAEMSGLGVDTRSDIYSLGVLLFELLTGSTPLDRKRVRAAAYGEILRMIKEEDSPKPSTRISESRELLSSISAQRHMEPAKLAKVVRGELDWIVMKSLDKDRNRRYATANGFAADVLRYLNDESVQACPASAAYHFKKFARRNNRLLATSGVVALALVVGTAVSTWQAIRATRAEGEANTNFKSAEALRKKAQEQVLLTDEANVQALHSLYEAELAQVKAGSLSRRSGQRLDSFETLASAKALARELRLPPAENNLRLRNAAIACLALPDLRIAKEWAGFPTGSVTLDFDGTLERYARVNRQGVVSIRRVANDAEIYCLAGIGPGESGTTFSADGQFLIHWRGHVVPRPFQVWSLAGKEPVMLLEVTTDTIAFSPDCSQMAQAMPDGSLRLYDLPSGREIKQLEAGPRVWMLAFHPKKSQLAVSCATGVQIRDLDTGKVLTDLAQPGAMHLVWHPDGKTLAVADGDRIVHIWDVAARKIIARLEGHKSGGIQFAFNHAGDLLASVCWDGFLRFWNPRTGEQLFHTPASIHSLHFSADDQLLAAGVEGDKIRIWEVATPSGYRTLARASVESKGYYHTSAIHPDGRLVAVGMADGVDMWDLATGRHLASIQLPTQNSHILIDRSGELLTSGGDHLRRWPIQVEPASGMVRVGPPQELPVAAVGRQIASSFDGRVLASAQYDGGLVLHRDRADPPIALGRHVDARHIAVSPDGRWVATGSHNGTKVKIWHAQSGKPEKELPVEIGSMVGFSPNGKWLATTGGGCRLWAVDSWEPALQINDGTAFSPFAFSTDSNLLAVGTQSGVVLLLDPDSGREYARLEDPNQDRANTLTFSRDGTQLVATTNDSHSIHVWDLRIVRERLAKLGLDWDLPLYPPPAPDNGKPLRVQVELGALLEADGYLQQAIGYLQANQWDKAVTEFSRAIELKPDLWAAFEGRRSAYAKLGQWDKIIDEYAKAIEVHPDRADFYNTLAWLLATCPDPKFRDPKRAVELGKKAVQLVPNDGNHRNTLGVAEYRAGDWKAAIETLGKSYELLGEKELSFNAFFLAMTHWHLGNKEEARKSYDQAVQWMDKNKPEDEELLRFRAEAAALLEGKDQ